MPFLLIALILMAEAAAAAGQAEHPNVLLVVIDTLRRDHVGCYGYSRPTTPNLDRLAAEGLKFDQTLAASSWTVPSIGSMFTSLHPSMHGLISYKHKLAAGLTTLAAELRSAGYQTAAITANPSTHRRYGINRGFEFYDDYTILMDFNLEGAEETRPDAGVTGRATGEMVTRLAVRWLSKQRKTEQPFFLHLFYFDPHYDYLPPAPFDKMFTDRGYKGSQTGARVKELMGKPLNKEDKEQLVALYDGEIRYADEQLAKLLETMKELGILDSTLVVVTGDHGEEFWEHGNVTHAHTLYDELLKVPLVMRWPGRIKPGTVVTNQAGLIDLMPSLLDLVGLPIPPQCLGRSLAETIRGDATHLAEAEIFFELDAEASLKAVRTGAMKLIEQQPSGELELYAIGEDPGEQKNLAKTDRVGEFDALKRKFLQWKTLVQSEAGKRKDDPKGTGTDFPPEIFRQLKSLGYAQ